MIRYLDKGEKQNIRELYNTCFSDRREYREYYLANKVPNNIIAVNEDDGEIKSMLQLVPKTAVIGKLKTELNYIYGICTSPLYRSEGYMKELMQKVLHDLYRNLDAFTYLIPTDENTSDMYRKFGFEYVMDHKELKPEHLRKKATHSLMLRRADKQDLVKLSIFAQTNTENRYKVTLAKNMDYFRELEALIELEGGYIELYVENLVIMGYRVWIDGKIYEEVLDSSIASMSYFGNERKPYLMARVMNIRKTLRLLDFKGDGVKVIKINDPVIPENTGVFRLSYQRNDLKVTKLKGDVIPEMEISINDLTAHIFGYRMIPGFPKVCNEDAFFINDYI